MAGQAGAVAVGALDPDQAHGPEPAQPVQQAGIAGRGDRELLDAEQAPDGIQRGGDVHVRMGVHAASDGASLRWSQPSLSVVEGWHAPAGRRTCEPRPLAQARQIGPAAPVGAIKNLGPGRQIVSRTARDGVSRFGGQAGTQATDPTPVPPQNQGSRAGSTIYILPSPHHLKTTRSRAGSTVYTLPADSV